MYGIVSLRRASKILTTLVQVRTRTMYHTHTSTVNLTLPVGWVHNQWRISIILNVVHFLFLFHGSVWDHWQDDRSQVTRITQSKSTSFILLPSEPQNKWHFATLHQWSCIQQVNHKLSEANVLGLFVVQRIASARVNSSSRAGLSGSRLFTLRIFAKTRLYAKGKKNRRGECFTLSTTTPLISLQQLAQMYGSLCRLHGDFHDKLITSVSLLNMSGR